MQQGVGRGPWIFVDPPQAFDVMVARRDMHSRYPGHVGVMIDGARVLHIWEGRDVHISRIGEPTLAGLILGFYRHRSAAGPHWSPPPFARPSVSGRNGCGASVRACP